MKTKTKIAGAIAAILAGALTVGTAQADPIASAEALTVINSFTISHTGGAQVSASDFVANSLTVTSNQQTGAAIPSASSPSPIQTSTTGKTLTSTEMVGSAPAPQLAQLTANGNGESVATSVQTFSALNPFPNPSLVNNFAGSGSNELGSPITGFSPSPLPASATLNNASYATLNAITGSAGSTTNSTLKSAFSFKVSSATALTFSFDLGTYLASYLTPGAHQSASADYSIHFELVGSDGSNHIITGAGINVGSITAVTPALLGNPAWDCTIGGGTLCALKTLTFGGITIGGQVSSNGPVGGFKFNTGDLSGLNPANSTLDGSFKINSFNHFDLHTDTLLAGVTYTLNAFDKTSAQVVLTTVPEPETLALLGIGLLGMGFSSRKAKNSSLATYA